MPARWFSPGAARRCRAVSKSRLAVYAAIGQPERMVEWCRAQLARRGDTHHSPGQFWSLRCPWRVPPRRRWMPRWPRSRLRRRPQPVHARVGAVAYGFAFRDADPVGALNALNRGLVIAHDSGNREASQTWRTFWPDLRPSTATRWPRSITSLWRSAATSILATPRTVRVPLANLAVLLDRLGRHEPAATIAGFALSPLTTTGVPRDHRRDRPPARCPRRPDLRIARHKGER